MNYIKQINAFWNWRKYNDDISHSAADLYFAILHCANESGWKTQVDIPNSTLMATAQIVNKSVLSTLRNKLVQKGLIKYIPGKKNKAPKYIVVTLYSTDFDTKQATDVNIDTDIGSAQNTNLHTYPNTNPHTNSKTNQRTIYKQKQKQNKTILSSDDDKVAAVVECYKKSGICKGTPAPLFRDIIKSYIYDGVEPDMICEAINDAAKSGAHSWRYVESILINKTNAGIKTLEGYKNSEKEFRKRSGRDKSTQRSAFNNYEDTNKIDYDELEKQILDNSLNG